MRSDDGYFLQAFLNPIAPGRLELPTSGLGSHLAFFLNSGPTNNLSCNRLFPEQDAGQSAASQSAPYINQFGRFCMEKSQKSNKRAVLGAICLLISGGLLTTAGYIKYQQDHQPLPAQLLPQQLEGAHFDPNTGEPLQVFYRNDDGTIELFPIGTKYHLRTGAELQPITREVAAEFDRAAQKSTTQTMPDAATQKGLSASSSVSSLPETARSVQPKKLELRKYQTGRPRETTFVRRTVCCTNEYLVLEAESVEITPSETLINLVAEGLADHEVLFAPNIGYNCDWLKKDISLPYLVDDLGQKQHMTRFVGSFTQREYQDDIPEAVMRELAQGEVYKYTIVFPQINLDASNIAITGHFGTCKEVKLRVNLR